MNIKKSKVAAVIRKDATLQGANYILTVRNNKAVPVEGQFCIIGGLLNYGGYKHLLKERAHCSTYMLSANAVNFLYETYGLDIVQLSRLQAVNDKFKTTPARRKALLALLKKL